MRAIVAAQRALGLTQVTPSPQGDPEVRDINGQTASLVDRDADQSERERLANEARSLTEPLDPDFVDPNTFGSEELFVGRRSLAWLLPTRVAGEWRVSSDSGARWRGGRSSHGDSTEGGARRALRERLPTVLSTHA